VIDPLVDYGDAPVLPADAARSHAAIEATVGEVLEAGKVDPERYVQIGLRGYGPAVGSADVTALVADRIVREILTGIALKRRR
jgi:hypothetical protein